MKYDAERWASEPVLRPRGYPKLPYGPFRVVDGYVVEFPTDGFKAIKFIERNLCFTNGKWVGQPFKMAAWQKQWMLDLFELDEYTAKRKVRTAALWTPKKQGKTELAAALGHYFMEGDGEPSPSVAVAAAAEGQADLVFGAARTMAEQSPALEGLLEVYDREIRVPGVPNARLRRVPAIAGKFDGQHLYVGLADEYHEWMEPRQRKMAGMMRGALAVRDNPLFLVTSTVGESEEEIEEEEWSPWWMLYQYTKRWMVGEVQDDAFLGRLWGATDEQPWRAKETLSDPYVNPNFGVTVQWAFYADELTKRTSADFQRYYLNRVVDSLTAWLEPGVWESCAVAENPELLPNVACWLGWDASTKKDSTVLVWVQWQDIDGKPRLACGGWGWERPMRDGKWDDTWRVPTEEVLEKVREVCTRFNVQSVAYDPYFIAWVAADLVTSGLPLIEWPQTPQRMAPATQALFEVITDQVLAHGNVALQNRHIRGVKAKTVRGGGQMLSKERGRRNDFAIGLSMAVGEAMGGAEPDSVYETRGVLTT